MKKIAIALGTTSKWKIDFVKKVLKEIGIPNTIDAIKTDSKVADQPISEEETIKGSINRARQAIESDKRADIGLGIEVGYAPDKKKQYEMFCYATIAEKDGILISACSHKFLLPKFYQEVLKNNKEMHLYVDKYYKKDDHPATQYMAKMIDERETFIKEATRSAILRYFRKEDY